jgi:CRP-like cAMP-binding protein
VRAGRGRGRVPRVVGAVSQGVMAMTELIAGFAADTLRRCELFRGFSDDLIAELAARAAERFFDPGETILEIDHPAENIYVVESGRISLVLPLPDGREISVRDVGPGEVFGWMALVEPRRFTGTARCAHESAVVELPARALEEVFVLNPARGYAVMQRVATLVAAWLRDTQAQLVAALTD